jgi:hypothetical protein
MADHLEYLLLMGDHRQEQGFLAEKVFYGVSLIEL